MCDKQCLLFFLSIYNVHVYSSISPSLLHLFTYVQTHVIIVMIFFLVILPPLRFPSFTYFSLHISIFSFVSSSPSSFPSTWPFVTFLSPPWHTAILYQLPCRWCGVTRPWRGLGVGVFWPPQDTAAARGTLNDAGRVHLAALITGKATRLASTCGLGGFHWHPQTLLLSFLPPSNTPTS